MKHKRIKSGIEINVGNLLLLCMIIIAVTAVAGRAEMNQPEDDVESVLFDESQVGVIVDANHLYEVETEESFVDQPVQSINFKKDMPIRDALRFLAARYRRNIIPSSRVSGNLNITSLYEVTFEGALNAILGHDYRYETDGNFIRVYTAEEYAKFKQDKTRMTSRTFELFYVNATEIKALIVPILSESGQIASTSAAAVDTEAGAGGDTPTMRDTIVVFDFPERLDEIGKMIRQIDVKPQQILIEVTVLKATLTESTKFGIEWDTIKGFHAIDKSHNGISVGLAAATTDILTDTGLDIGFNHGWIVAEITALEDISDVTVLANPKIMALNKQAGHINIGDETGYIDSITNNENGTQTQSISFLESGTLLKFRPFICDNEYVRMEINPEESTASLRTEGTAQTQIPTKSITQLKTNIMVKDGRTIIIGGLFKESLTNTDSQVPVVGDWPVIGALFKKTKNANVRSELIILITPHIIDEPEEFASVFEEREEDVSRIVEGSRKRMSSISRVRIYEEKYAKAVKYYSEKKYNKALVELDWIIAYRPNAVEAVQLKEKILAETRPDEYRELERIKLDDVRKEQDVMWRRR
jgi:type IV pilus assembly protein PilQ